MLAILDNGTCCPPRNRFAGYQYALAVTLNVDFLGWVHAQHQHCACRRADDPAPRYIDLVGSAAIREAGDGTGGAEFDAATVEVVDSGVDTGVAAFVGGGVGLATSGATGLLSPTWGTSAAGAAGASGIAGAAGASGSAGAAVSAGTFELIVLAGASSATAGAAASAGAGVAASSDDSASTVGAAASFAAVFFDAAFFFAGAFFLLGVFAFFEVFPDG